MKIEKDKFKKDLKLLHKSRIIKNLKKFKHIKQIEEVEYKEYQKLYNIK
jgi:hypothetical protein